jgi:uncharacterized delta-60 repeat protein
MLIHRLCGALLLYSLPLAPVSNVLAAEPPGSLDVSFHIGTGADATVHSIVLQPDGKIFFGGRFNSYNGTPRNRIVRVHPFGSIDSGFVSPITDPTADVLAITIQTNGQILVGLEGQTNLMRLNADGQIDATFNIGTGPDGTVHAIELQPDGRILIGGEFTHFNGTSRSRVARLNSNGTLDNTFDPGAGANYHVLCVALQPDGRILIGGQFSQYRTVGRNYIARLTDTGALDLTFDPGQGASQNVQTIALQPDGKPVIGGFFDAYDGHTQYSVARLNTNGTYDASFGPLTDLQDGTVFGLQLQRDGKIVVAGDMTQGHLVRLNTDGTKDLTYQPGSGPDDDVYAMAIQPDQKIVIGGLFAGVGGASSPFLARINSDLKLLNPVKNGATFTTQIQTVSGKIYHLEYKDFLNQAWTPIPSTTVTGDGSIKVLTNTTATVQQRYYQAVGVTD